MIHFYQYKKCSSCVKASKFLKSKSIEFKDIDITEKPPTKSQLQTMLKNYNGEIKKLFNTSGVQYRELNIKEKLPNMSDEQAIELLSRNGKLVKRPFLLDGNRGVVGFNEAVYVDFFKN